MLACVCLSDITNSIWPEKFAEFSFPSSPHFGINAIYIACIFLIIYLDIHKSTDQKFTAG